jgi:archaeal flagellar protein FlaH
MIPKNGEKENKSIISTGHPEIDKKLGGGIPIGSLVLIEGQSDAGKSVLCQQMIWGSLTGGFKVVLFTTENSVKSLTTQMESLGLGILDYLLLGRLKVFYMKPSQIKVDPAATFDAILATIDKNNGYQLAVIDSLTPIVSGSEILRVLSYFERCKSICDQGRTIMNVTHTYALDNDTMIRVRSACDAHLKLTIEKVGDKLVKSLEVAKVRGASQNTGNVVAFEVEPEVGMKIMPMSRAKA